MGNQARKLDIAEISQKTGIPPRRLRYVLDHDIFLKGNKASSGRGARRNFYEYEAFGIACAALRLEGGLRQGVVRGVMDILTKSDVGPSFGLIDSLLVHALGSDKFARLDVGDGVNVRLSLSTSKDASIVPVKDTGWRQVATGAQLTKPYEPLIKLSIDVMRLRNRLEIRQR
jgi:hypothetical protein